MALRIAALTGGDETWRKKAKAVLEEPLHPTLPLCRIPMKNNNTQAAYQSILSFPLTAAQTAGLTGGSDNRKSHLKANTRVDYYHLFTNCAKLLIHDSDNSQFDRRSGRSMSLRIYLIISGLVPQIVKICW